MSPEELCGSDLFYFSLHRNLFPANLVAAAFRSVSASSSLHHTVQTPSLFSLCCFSPPLVSVCCALFIKIYFTDQADVVPCSFSGCSPESLLMRKCSEERPAALCCSPQCLSSLSFTSCYHGETIPFQRA